MKKAILIDSKNREVRQIEIGNQYTEIYKAIGCEIFEVVHIGGINDVYVDEEGLLSITPDTRFFKIEGFPDPLAGNGLILGVNEDGESIDTDMTVEQVKNMVTFHSLMEVQKMFS